MSEEVVEIARFVTLPFSIAAEDISAATMVKILRSPNLRVPLEGEEVMGDTASVYIDKKCVLFVRVPTKFVEDVGFVTRATEVAVIDRFLPPSPSPSLRTH
jgi:hypothetical protein